MKLYNVPRDTWVRVVEPELPPPSGAAATAGQRIKFGHIDGMYSFCHDADGNIVHLKAWTEVEICTS